ncbi:MAG: hypothetical protein QNI91_05500 [Arenicellales bacterium]|nr:hypothetical protein [Arenicellales bacterium]
MGNTLEFKVRIRDILVGVTACLLFSIATLYTGQQPIASALASVIFGYTTMLASTHLWAPWERRD